MKCFNCSQELTAKDVNRMKLEAKRYSVSIEDILDICSACAQERDRCHQRELENQDFDSYYGY